MRYDVRQDLEELLDREISAAHGLAEILTAEQAALTGDSPDAVTLKAAEKVKMLGDLENFETQRRALWQDSGADDASGAGSAIAERWRSLLKVMAACRTANEVNGHIIHVRQNQVRQLFDIVRGGAPMTYGPQGKTFARTLRALARA